MRSHKGFDRISWIYDFLVRVVFGSSLRKAQVEPIKSVSSGKDWLVIGGGTGWVLEEIFKTHPEVHVTYLEASQGMLNKTKARKITGKINYILGSTDELRDDHAFDIIVTNFFWDMYSTESALVIKNKIEQHLKNEAQWLVTDFKNSDIWWQQGLMKIMYWFFRVTCRIEAKELPDFDKLFELERENQLNQTTFHSGMIESVIYRRK